MKIALLIIIASFLTGCKKFLEEKPDKSLVVLKSLQDLQGVLDDHFLMNGSTPSFGESSSDDYFLPTDMYNSFDENAQREYRWDWVEYRYSNDWADSYGVIFNANYCLEQIEKIEKAVSNNDTWNNIKGSALFFRGYYLLNLIWEYGKAYDDITSSTDLGIVLKLSSDFNTLSVRSSVKDAYNQIISDLKDATQFLSDNPIHPMRPSKGASYAALARTYLTMRNYDSAYKYANLALQIKDDLLDYNEADVDPNSEIPFQPFNKEIYFYTTQSFNHYIQSPYYAAIDTLLYASYHSNDLRRYAFFTLNNDFYSFKGSYADDPYTFFTGISTDEMYLVRAESLARIGNLDPALSDLNHLLRHRWITGTFTPIDLTLQMEILDTILAERRKELLMRGLRWIDIKRLNKEGRGITPKRAIDQQTYTLQPNDNKYALPLPKDIIDITGMQQN